MIEDMKGFGSSANSPGFELVKFKSSMACE